MAVEVHAVLGGLAVGHRGQHEHRPVAALVARDEHAVLVELVEKAVLLLEQADGVKNGHAIAMLEAEIGAKKAHVDGILKSIEMMQNLDREASNDRSGIQGMEG